MTRQVHNQQGRRINPLQAVLFIAALLAFIFTVVYRMMKSATFSNALATLVESLFSVAFFLFLGMLLVYMIYLLYERFHHGSRRPDVHDMFDDNCSQEPSPSKPDRRTIELAAKK
jgi:predicted membrane protein